MIKHVSFDFDFGFNLNDSDNFSSIKLVDSTTKGAEYKVLYVLDYIPSLDLHNRDTLLSGNGLETFENVLKYSKLPAHNYSVVSFHACRTVNMPQVFIDNAFEAFERRLFNIVEAYKPDKIVCFGRRPFRVICEKQMQLVGKKPSQYDWCTC